MGLVMEAVWTCVRAKMSSCGLSDDSSLNKESRRLGTCSNRLLAAIDAFEDVNFIFAFDKNSLSSPAVRASHW